MAQVFSKKLVDVPAFAGGPTQVFVCPPGFVAVVKFAAITIGLNPNPCWGAISLTASGAIFHSFGVPLSDVPTHDKETFSLWCHVPMEVTEGISIETSLCTADFVVGGYLLSTP